jgi:hypothetical protein
VRKIKENLHSESLRLFTDLTLTNLMVWYFEQGDFNVISRDISKGLLKRETVVCYEYPASAYQINKKITVMILKKENSLLTDKARNLSTDVIQLLQCNKRHNLRRRIHNYR